MTREELIQNIVEGRIKQSKAYRGTRKFAHNVAGTQKKANKRLSTKLNTNYETAGQAFRRATRDYALNQGSAQRKGQRETLFNLSDKISRTTKSGKAIRARTNKARLQTAAGVLAAGTGAYVIKALKEDTMDSKSFDKFMAMKKKAVQAKHPARYVSRKLGRPKPSESKSKFVSLEKHIATKKKKKENLGTVAGLGYLAYKGYQLGKKARKGVNKQLTKMELQSEENTMTREDLIHAIFEKEQTNEGFTRGDLIQGIMEDKYAKAKQRLNSPSNSKYKAIAKYDLTKNPRAKKVKEVKNKLKKIEAIKYASKADKSKYMRKSLVHKV